MPAEGSSVQVSIVMVTYKTGPVLWQSIVAVLNEQTALELIIVNNGNPPQDEARLLALAESDVRVTLVTGHGNIGFSRGCNLGASHAQARFLMLLNPDCVLSNGSLVQLIEASAQGKENDLFGANLVDVNFQTFSNARREFVTPWRMAVEILQLYRLAPRHPYFRRLDYVGVKESNAAMQVPAISGALMFMNKSIYENLKGMDEDYFLHVEDMDFCLRHHLAGGETYFLPKVFACHHQSSSDESWLTIERHKAKSFTIYFDKHFAPFYPRLFLIGVKGAVYMAFFARVIKRLLSYPIRRWSNNTAPLGASNK